MATINDLVELAIKNRRLDIEDREIIVGYSLASEVYGRLSSFLIGGMTQQGKSVIAAFLACQHTALAGTHIILIDPHCHNKKRGLLPKLEPLAPWFAMPPVDFSDVDEVVSRFQWLDQEYRRRKQSMAGAAPILLLIDEFNEFLTGCGLSKQQKTYVTQVIANVARGGAKHGLFTGIILHNADVSKSGGSEIRYNVGMRLAVNCESREQCKILDYEDKKGIEEIAAPGLRPGQALVKRQGFELRVLRYPEVTRAYCNTVAQFVSEYERSAQTKAPGNIPEMEPLPMKKHSQEYSQERFSVKTERLQVPAGAECFSAQTAPIQPIEGITEFPGISITEQERLQIMQEGLRQIREKGYVIRTLIRDRLGWDNDDGYRKIRAVCDTLGWDRAMHKDKLEPGTWEAIKAQYNHTCQRCQRREPDITLEPDRVVPAVKGGSYVPGNIQPLCKSCNSSKREKIVDYRQIESSVV